MTDLEKILMRRLLETEAALQQAESAHVKNTQRASEIMQDALARAERAEKALADLKCVTRIFEQVDMDT